MEFLKKNGFWISSFLLTAAMVGTWFYATGQLKTATDARVSKLEAAESTITAVTRIEAEDGTTAHPNQTTQDGMGEKINVLTDSIVQAWQMRYDAQKKILKWPDRLLGQVFIQEFVKYVPPETLPAEEKGTSVRMKRILDTYALQIPVQMESICSIIQTNWQYQEQLREAASLEEDQDEEGDETTDDSTEEDGRIALTVSPREIVKWNPINQTLWLAKLTNFKGRDDNEFENNRPSPSQVLMLQQDLWLLEAMFNIIREVNAQMVDGKMMMDDEGMPVMVQANDLAPVKEIDHVVFGREALAKLGEIQDTITPGGGGSDQIAAKAPSRGGRGGRGGRNTQSRASDGGFSYLGQPAFHGRYVDENFDPIESQTIRKVLTENAIPADNLELLIAKRVPVRLAVQMDEREIPRFLAACANSPFAFEVWQVRINKHSSDEVIQLRGGGGDGGDRTGLGEAGQRGFGADDGNRRRRKKGQVTPALRKDFNVGVEFYGIVKIYNPVNEELLTGQKADDATTEEKKPTA